MDALETADELRFGLDLELPEHLVAGARTALFCAGWCFHRDREVRGLTIVADGTRQAAAAARMPRPDVFESAGRDPRSFRSGFWATVPVAAREEAGSVELALEAQLTDGGAATATLGTIPVVHRPPPSVAAARRGARTAICMATFEPPEDLLAIQIESIRAQTDDDWICLVSDDCSSAERFAGLERVLAGDERFVVSRSERRLGFYRNFERALSMVPPGVELVALCDQDDRWRPDKVEALRAAIGDAQLAFSDLRLIDERGRVLAASFWEGRRNNYTNLASLLVANTITGASMLLRREVVDAALPFPSGPGWQFHDHWLAQVALARGEIAYVDQPLYDYVQHGAAVIGGVPDPRRRARLPSRLRAAADRRRGLLGRWRTAYFRGYAHLALQCRVLLERCDAQLAPRKRRALRWVIAADRSSLALAWLALRPLRRIVGRDETLGAETVLVRGLLWRRLVALVDRLRREDRRTDASVPPLDPVAIGPRRVTRWRATLSTPRA